MNKFKLNDKVVTKASVENYPRRRGIVEDIQDYGYRVRFSDGEGYWYDGSELNLYVPKKKYVPKVGDYVEIVETANYCRKTTSHIGTRGQIRSFYNDGDILIDLEIKTKNDDVCIAKIVKPATKPKEEKVSNPLPLKPTPEEKVKGYIERAEAIRGSIPSSNYRVEVLLIAQLLQNEELR